MSSIFSKTRNTTLRNHIDSLRNMAAMGGCAFLLWGIITAYVEAFEFEIWPVRIVISLVLMGCWFVPKIFPKITLEKFEFAVAIIGSSAVGYAFYMSWSAGLHPAWIVGSALIIVGVLNFLTYFWPTVLFSGFAAILSLSSFWFENPKISAGSLVLNFSTAVFLGIFSSIQRNIFLRRSLADEERQNSIVSNMREGVVMHAADGTILAINDAAPRILGLSEDQILGKSNIDPQWKTFNEDGSPCSPEQHPSAVAQSTGKPVINYPMVIIKPTGERAHIKITAVPVFGENEKIPKSTIVTIDDVTAVVEAQKDIEEQRESLAVASGLTSLGEMAAGIAHEINNPLAIIVGKLGMLKTAIRDKKWSEEQLVEKVESLEQTTYRISKIVKSMKSLSRQQGSDLMKKVELSSVLEDVLEISRDRFKNAETKLDIQVPKEIELECHPGQIGQIFINLFNNSLDAIEGLPEKWIRVEAGITGQLLEITITDSGSGIPVEIRDKILNPFFTTKDAGKGTGLGLSLVRTIANSHGGDIQIDEKCPNTQFVLRLPVEQKD